MHKEAYKTAKIYKAKTKSFHGKIISRKYFEPNQKVWLFNSNLKLFPSKLRSRWDGPFVAQQVFPSEAVKITGPEDGCVLTINGERLKPIVINEIELDLIESINLVDAVYYD